jgi:hypothetical protein
MKKYILTDESKVVDGVTVYRIKALINFEQIGHPDDKLFTVGKDQLGGFVESEDNLSQDNNCWIAKDSVVYGAARIVGDAKIQGASKIHGQVWIGGKIVVNNAEVSGNFFMVTGTSTVEHFSDFKI